MRKDKYKPKEKPTTTLAHPKTNEKNSKSRIIQRNLVYLIGLPRKYASQEVLMQPTYMGQYGTVEKIVISNHIFTVQGEPQYSAYVTYASKFEAALAILALLEFKFDRNTLKAHYGTSKYCSYFLKNQICTNGSCVFQHATADPADTLSQEQIQRCKSQSQIHQSWALDVLQDHKLDLLSVKSPDKVLFPNASIVALQIYKKLQEFKSPCKKKSRLINIIDESPLKESAKGTPGKKMRDSDSYTISTAYQPDYIEEQESYSSEDLKPSPTKELKFSHDLNPLSCIDQKVIEWFLCKQKNKRRSCFIFASEGDPESNCSFSIEDLILKHRNSEAGMKTCSQEFSLAHSLRPRLYSLQNCDFNF